VTALLEVRDLTKIYDAAVALDGVDLTVERGQVHCLVGQNGAGKSTLIKCISGATEPTSGTIELDGTPLPTGSPSASLAAGVATTYQELDLVDALSVADNIFLGHERRRGGLIAGRRAAVEARELLGRLGRDDIDPKRLVGEMRPAAKQVVSIARALSHDARLLMMDEPSAVFDSRNVDSLFDIVERLISEGVGIVYISHRLDEVERIGHTVTVIRDGRTVATDLSPTAPRQELIALLVGRELAAMASSDASSTATTSSASPTPTGVAKPAPSTDRSTDSEPVLRVRGLTRRPDVIDVDLDLYAGEILGIGGLVGAGRTELLRLIHGVEKQEAGSVELGGRELSGGRPDQAVAAGIGFAPEERKSQGLWRFWSLARNVSVAGLSQFRRGPFLDLAAERADASEHLRSIRTVPDDSTRLVGELSGGNQQKVVLARWLSRKCRVLLLDEPTRGVDVGARAEIYRVIRDLSSDGIAILVVSSELDELVELCHRVVVMRDGALVTSLEGEHLTEAEILAHAIAPPGTETP